MLHQIKPNRTYDPDTIALMTAFGQVRSCLPPRIHDNKDIKRGLATAILRLVDQGERDPVLLVDAAFRELAGTHRSASGWMFEAPFRFGPPRCFRP